MNRIILVLLYLLFMNCKDQSYTNQLKLNELNLLSFNVVPNNIALSTLGLNQNVRIDEVNSFKGGPISYKIKIIDTNGNCFPFYIKNIDQELDGDNESRFLSSDRSQISFNSDTANILIQLNTFLYKKYLQDRTLNDIAREMLVLNNQDLDSMNKSELLLTETVILNMYFRCKNDM